MIFTHSNASSNLASVEVVEEQLKLGPGARALLIAATLVVVAFGVKFAAPVLIPLLLGVCVATAVQPLVELCTRKKMPPVAAVGLGMLVVLSAVSLFVFVFSYGVAELSQSLPRFERSLNALRLDAYHYFSDHHMHRFAVALLRFDTGAAVAAAATGAAKQLPEVVTSSVIVLLIVAFVLLERQVLRQKLVRAFKLRRLALIVDGAFLDVQHYLWMKTVLSAATGVLCGVLCYAAGVSNAGLWGMAAFVLNFAPMIGSLIAAIPPVVVALVELGPSSAALVAASYVLINTLIGNVIEPRMMGRALGLSPLVVLVSMVVWGWLLGPVGALLSTPLTMAVKIAASYSPDLAFIAVLLGDGKRVQNSLPPDEPVPRASDALVGRSAAGQTPHSKPAAGF